MKLKSSIRDTERSIAARRSRLRVGVAGVRREVATRMVSPGALVTAGLFGAALHRDHRAHGLRALALLQALNSALRRLLTLSAWTRPPSATP